MDLDRAEPDLEWRFFECDLCLRLDLDLLSSHLDLDLHSSNLDLDLGGLLERLRDWLLDLYLDLDLLLEGMSDRENRLKKNLVTCQAE